MVFFIELEQKKLYLYVNKKRSQTAKNNNEKIRMELVESYFLTSDYTTKLQSSKQYGTGTKTEI